MKLTQALRKLAGVVCTFVLSVIIVGCEGESQPLPPVTPSPVPLPTKPEPKPEVKPDPKPAESKPEAKPEMKPEAKPAAKEEAKGLPALTPPADASKEAAKPK